MRFSYIRITPSRQYLFQQVTEIVFHGKGGFTWEEVWRMPTPYRRYVFNYIQDFYRKESEAYKKASSESKKASKGIPNFRPDYKS